MQEDKKMFKTNRADFRKLKRRNRLGINGAEILERWKQLIESPARKSAIEGPIDKKQVKQILAPTAPNSQPEN